MGTTCTWTAGAGTHSWSDKNNWDPRPPRGPDDDIVISRRGVPQPDAAPAGLAVRRLTVGPGTEASVGGLTVNEEFVWTGGDLRHGVRLTPAAQLVISGPVEKILRAPIEVHRARIEAGEVSLIQGARLVNQGLMSTTGDCRMWWRGGARPFLLNNGELRVESGTFQVIEVPLRSSGSVTLLAGSVLSIEHWSQLSTLDRKCRVGGAGRLRLTNGGRLYAERTARILKGATVEVANGVIDGRRAGELVAGGTYGKVGKPQRLIVDGALVFNGGRIGGDASISRTGTLTVGGTAEKSFESGLVVVNGAGELSGTLKVWDGTLRNQGELLMKDGFVITDGRHWAFENKGILRIAGSVHYGDNPLSNSGVVHVERGRLRLEFSRRYLQRSGRLVVAAGAELACDKRLDIAGGSLEGSGSIAGSVVAQGEVIPGKPRAPGRLTIDGMIWLSRSSRLRIGVRGPLAAPTCGELEVSGGIGLAGTLLVEFPKELASDPAGTTFVPVRYASYLGTFSSIQAEGLDPSYRLVPEYTPTAVEVHVALAPNVPAYVTLDLRRKMAATILAESGAGQEELIGWVYFNRVAKERGAKGLLGSSAYAAKNEWYRIWLYMLGDPTHANDPLPPDNFKGYATVEDFCKRNGWMRTVAAARAREARRRVDEMFSSPERNPIPRWIGQGNLPDFNNVSNQDIYWKRARQYFWLQKRREVSDQLVIEIESPDPEKNPSGVQFVFDAEAIKKYFQTHPLPANVPAYTP